VRQASRTAGAPGGAGLCVIGGLRAKAAAPASSLIRRLRRSSVLLDAPGSRGPYDPAPPMKQPSNNNRPTR